MNDFNERAFNLIPLETYFSDDAEPGPSRCSGDEDNTSDMDVDRRVEEDPFPTAGHVIRMDSTLHENGGHISAMRMPMEIWLSVMRQYLSRHLLPLPQN